MPLPIDDTEKNSDEMRVPYVAPCIDLTDFPKLPQSTPPESAPPTDTEKLDLPVEKPGWGAIIGHSIFGVILPIVTLGVEISTGMCAEEFFDPIPTFGHVALLATIPLVNLLTLVALRIGARKRLGALLFWNSFALGVAIFYSLLFLPITPLALVAIFFLIGFLPLSPALSWISTGCLRSRLRAACESAGIEARRTGRVGLALGLGLLVVAEVPSIVTEVGLRLAASENRAQQSSGLAILRSIGNNDALLRSCYQRRQGMDITGGVSALLSLPSTSVEQARTIYYRVNGEPFNAEAPPSLAVRSLRSEAFDVDMDQGEDRVGSFVRGLSLGSSRIDASIDPDAALSYTEWTMTFENISDDAREARMLVALPPGGAVSRLTLWINGQEEEAAFGSRGDTRAAYESVVSQRRDPVLVSSAGVDRVLVQCFPVPAREEGEMKIRFGITAPLIPVDLENARYLPPTLLERNFRLPERGNDLWVESKGMISLASPTLRAEPAGNGHWRARGQTGNAEGLVAPDPITVTRTASNIPLWTDDRLDSTQIIQQKIVERSAPAPRRVALVVDGSAGMEDAVPMIATALRELPAGLDISVIVASEEARELATGKGSADFYEQAADELEDFDVYGGKDNLPALNKGWDYASASSDGVVLWIHAAQPVELESIDGLLQRFQRSKHGPALYELQVGGGRNRILEGLDGFVKVHGLERGPFLPDALRRAFAMLKPEGAGWTIERNQIPRSNPARAMIGRRGSDHIGRLWAKEEIDDLAHHDRDAATRLAITYQLVTPVSGAVVLESQEQYASAGLTQVSPGSVPSVPEPETWAMIIVSMFIVGWTVLRALTNGGSA